MEIGNFNQSSIYLFLIWPERNWFNLHLIFFSFFFQWSESFANFLVSTDWLTFSILCQSSILHSRILEGVQGAGLLSGEMGVISAWVALLGPGGGDQKAGEEVTVFSGAFGVGEAGPVGTGASGTEWGLWEGYRKQMK